jgi:SAM-dependent methyltransferase
MHNSVLAFVAKHVDAEFTGRSVLEVGSANVNGSVRPQIEALKPARYVGIDLAAGPGVDAVCAAEHAPDALAADLVISCEMLEHAQDWRAAFRRMCQLVVPGGALVLTCRGLGFPFHNPPDHWRFEPSDLWRASILCGLWPVVCEADPQVPGVFLVARRMFGANSQPLQPHAENVIGQWPLVRRAPVGR